MVWSMPRRSRSRTSASALSQRTLAALYASRALTVEGTYCGSAHGNTGRPGIRRRDLSSSRANRDRSPKRGFVGRLPDGRGRLDQWHAAVCVRRPAATRVVRSRRETAWHRGDPGLYFQKPSYFARRQAIATTASRQAGSSGSSMQTAEPPAGRRTIRGAASTRSGLPTVGTILFSGDNITALYRKDATGSAPDQRLMPFLPRVSNLTDWSRDGRFLLNTRATVETQNDIWVVPRHPRTDIWLWARSRNRTCARRSANPRAASRPSGPRAGSPISPMRADATKSTCSPSRNHAVHTGSPRTGVRSLQWGPDGRELFYRSSDWQGPCS